MELREFIRSSELYANYVKLEDRRHIDVFLHHGQWQKINQECIKINKWAEFCYYNLSTSSAELITAPPSFLLFRCFGS